jgi:hypothetical protein
MRFADGRDPDQPGTLERAAGGHDRAAADLVGEQARDRRDQASPTRDGCSGRAAAALNHEARGILGEDSGHADERAQPRDST